MARLISFGLLIVQLYTKNPEECILSIALLLKRENFGCIATAFNSLPFLIHQATGKILSYPKDPQLIMQQVETLPWGQDLLNTSKPNILNSLENILTVSILILTSTFTF